MLPGCSSKFLVNQTLRRLTSTVESCHLPRRLPMTTLPVKTTTTTTNSLNITNLVGKHMPTLFVNPFGKHTNWWWCQKVRPKNKMSADPPNRNVAHLENMRSHHLLNLSRQILETRFYLFYPFFRFSKLLLTDHPFWGSLDSRPLSEIQASRNAPASPGRHAVFHRPQPASPEAKENTKLWTSWENDPLIQNWT